LSAAVNVLKGTNVPLCLQLETGDAFKFPRAIIYNLAGILVTQINMQHVSDGLYRSESNYAMPDFDIVVQYIVYENAARTIKSIDFGEGKDFFVRDLGGSGGAGDV